MEKHLLFNLAPGLPLTNIGGLELCGELVKAGVEG
jgi:hypothetical protein